MMAIGKRHSGVGLLCVVALLGGCAGKPPSFKVLEVGVTQESPQASVVTFVLEGENSGKEPYPLREVAYSLSLDGTHVFEGTRRAEATLSAGGKQSIKLPVVVPIEEGHAKPTGQMAYRLSGTVEYETPGSLAEYFFDTGIRRPKASFGESGTLDFGG